MTGIYMFTNKNNGKSYIGQSVNIERRYKDHKRIGREDTFFHRVLEEEGFDNFDFYVIEVCKIDELNDKEIFYIKEFNTLIPNGYNVSEGGNSSHPMGLSSVNDVKEIMRLLKYTDMSNLEIGLLFNVSDQTISDINNGRTWRNEYIEYPIRKRKSIIKKYCEICGTELSTSTSGKLCRKCFAKTSITKPPISKDELFELLTKYSFIYVAKIFNVSDNTIRKWCDKYEIPKYSSYYRKLHN